MIMEDWRKLAEDRRGPTGIGPGSKHQILGYSGLFGDFPDCETNISILLTSERQRCNASGHG
jgi:hypothetical protein